MTTGFSATLSHNLNRGDEAIEIDQNAESWIASSVVLWMLMGVICGSVCMRLYGRRIAQLCLYVNWICGWLIVSYSRNVWSLLAGCVLIGLSAGSHSVVSAVYVGEISEPGFRGLISVQISLGVAVGILISHAQGVLLDWRTALRSSAVLPAIALALVSTFACESPTWLLLKGRVQTAKNVFLRLRNDALNCENELNSLIDAAAAYSNRQSQSQSSASSWRRQMSSKAFRKSFLVLNVLFVVQQGSGLNVIVFYAVTMLKTLSADSQSSSSAAAATADLPSSMIIVDTVRFFATLAACVLIKVTGRRKLYFCSACGAVLSLCAVIVCTLYQLSHLTLVLLMCAYIAFLYVGVSPIPWIMVGELYPANLKEFGICISSFCCFLTMLTVVKSALFFIVHLGTAITFAIYATVMLVGVVFLYFHLPETNNITLQQIEKNLNS
ncbi:facilitated trehalose transporter Tret1-like isoform X2 [Planococcus citri]